MDEKVKDIIELAILVNGGEGWRDDWCQCDPSVGHFECEYCAIFNALSESKKLLSLLSEKEKEIEGLRARMGESNRLLDD